MWGIIKNLKSLLKKEEPKITEEKKEARVPHWHEVYFKGDYDIAYVWADYVFTTISSGSLIFKLDSETVAVFSEQDVLYWIRTDD